MFASLSIIIQRVSEESKLFLIQAINAPQFTFIEDRDEILCRGETQDSLGVPFDPEPSPFANLGKLRLLKLMIQDKILVVDVVDDVEQEDRAFVPEVDCIEVVVKIIPTVWFLANPADQVWEFLAK